MTTRQHRAEPSAPPFRSDLYSRITGKIVADLAQGVRPWHRPWDAGHLEGRIIRPLRHNGIPYRGINVVMLWLAAAGAGYRSPHWLTFRQARELGGNVRKGEHGELVVYAERIIRTETDATGEESERAIPLPRDLGMQIRLLAGVPFVRAIPPSSRPPGSLSQPDNGRERFPEFRPFTVDHCGNEAGVAALVQGIRAQGIQGLARLASDVCRIGGILAGEFLRIAFGYEARQGGDVDQIEGGHVDRCERRYGAHDMEILLDQAYAR